MGGASTIQAAAHPGHLAGELLPARRPQRHPRHGRPSSLEAQLVRRQPQCGQGTRCCCCCHYRCSVCSWFGPLGILLAAFECCALDAAGELQRGACPAPTFMQRRWFGILHEACAPGIALLGGSTIQAAAHPDRLAAELLPARRPTQPPPIRSIISAPPAALWARASLLLLRLQAATWQPLCLHVTFWRPPRGGPWQARPARRSSGLGSHSCAYTARSGCWPEPYGRLCATRA